MKIIHFSKIAKFSLNPCNDNIHMFTQFFVSPTDEQRNKEINWCLNKNIKNPFLKKIHLLNERLYSDKEMIITPENQILFNTKVVQINIQKRLTYQDILIYIRENHLTGFFVICNADIIFDNSLSFIPFSDIHEKKKMFALLRYEYDQNNIANSVIFGPRFDSQDTWIFHSNHFISEKHEKVFHFHLGKPGCDNKLIYLLMILGFDVVNDPHMIKTYHVHKNIKRNYSFKDVVGEPWGFVVPPLYNCLTMSPSLGINLSDVCQWTRGFKDIQFHNNQTLFTYIQKKITDNQPFLIPRVSGIENNVAVFGRICKTQGIIPLEIQKYFQQVLPVMKTNAGIQLSNITSIIQYSDMYLSAFDNCEMFAGWENYGGYIGHIQQSYNYIFQHYNVNRQIIWAFNFDIFHYIFDNPWTLALNGKKILIISCFEQSIKKQIPIREKIYGIDLFPNCTFETLKPPITNGDENSKEFDLELNAFFHKLDDFKQTFDIALVSAGGYSTIICDHIFRSGKSAIQISGVLQMYFGILGKRWMEERKEAVDLFRNEHWTQPLDSEKPHNYMKIERGCYWL